MITHARIRGFKCFTDFGSDLNQLTLLSGGNGVGKSTFIQALLLTDHARTQHAHVALNGLDGLNLGQALDILRGPQVDIDLLNSEGAHGHWTFSAAEEDFVLRVNQRPTPQLPELENPVIYLQAERLGPRNVLAIDSRPDEDLRIGVQGEFVAHVLERLGSRQFRVRAELHHPTRDVGPTLAKQAEAWLQDLIPGIQIHVLPHPALSTAAVRMKKAGLRTDWLRPNNMGFGVSYALPIIVAGLIARPKSLLVIENPEAHLHPAAQSSIASFLARVSANNVQVVVETHSDHVLNGIRLATVDNHPLKYGDVNILHFSAGDFQPQVTPIRITSRGGLSGAPAGFFDQSENDIARILEARRG